MKLFIDALSMPRVPPSLGLSATRLSDIGPNQLDPIMVEEWYKKYQGRFENLKGIPNRPSVVKDHVLLSELLSATVPDGVRRERSYDIFLTLILLSEATLVAICSDDVLSPLTIKALSLAQSVGVPIVGIVDSGTVDGAAASLVDLSVGAYSGARGRTAIEAFIDAVERNSDK